MKWLLLTVCTLAAVGTQAAPLTDVRRHLDAAPAAPAPVREDCPPPWCEQSPTLHRLQAPDDPALYLGDVISYERPSDWRDFAPLRDEVVELTAGLTSDADKVAAIADWVKHSKTPAPHSYAAWPPSIIDIWGSPEGQCEEASFLLTAMLRAAGVPAMQFTTWNEEHAVVRAYVDGAWVVADATPTTPDNSGPARVYAPGDPALLPAYQERPISVLHDVALPGTGTTIDTFTLFAHEPVADLAALARTGLAYGTVAFPVTNQFLYYDPDRRVLADQGEPDQRVAITYHIEAEDGSCLSDRGSLYSQPISSLVPGVLFRTVDRTQPPGLGTFYPTGYIQTSLPTCGAWRVVYALSDEDLDAPSHGLAYAEFDLGSAGDFQVVRPEALQPVAGADMYCFRSLVGALEKLPTFEQLGGAAPR